MVKTNNRYRDDDNEQDEDDNVFDADDDYENEYEGSRNNNNPNQQQPPPEQAAPPRREFKYSTADLQESGHCKKYCLIFLMFVAMMLFMIGLSMILKHFFFSDVSDNAPQVPERNPNTSFPEDKNIIDQACSRGAHAADEGKKCREVCEPQFFKCCDPFHEFDLYNITADGEYIARGQGAPAADKVNGGGGVHAVVPGVNVNDTSASPTMTPTMAPTSAEFFKNQTEKWAQCHLDTELRGCMAYAKCQSLGKQIDAAPSTLPVLCNKHHLELDPVSCQELCKPVRCCYSDTDNCLADDFAICMDYAPCQNLREALILETAPDDLDQACFYQQPKCNELCELAKCCSDPESSCLQDNFIACLTYAPCTGATRTNITLPPQFSVVTKPPVELLAACEEKHELSDGAMRPAAEAYASTPCPTLCEQAKCCWEHNHVDNCFFEDPLGCLAWEQQCQVLFV